MCLVSFGLYAHVNPDMPEQEHHDLHVAERDALADTINTMQEQIDRNTAKNEEQDGRLDANDETDARQQREINWNTRKNDQQDDESIVDSAISGNIAGASAAVVKTHRKISEVLHRVYPTPNIDSPHPEFPLIPFEPPVHKTPPPLPEPPEPPTIQTPPVSPPTFKHKLPPSIPLVPLPEPTSRPSGRYTPDYSASPPQLEQSEEEEAQEVDPPATRL